MIYTPLRLLIFYLLATVAMCAFGPIIYAGFNPPLTVIYIVSVCFFITLGYLHGIHVPINVPRDSRKHKLFPLEKFFYFCLFFSIFGLLSSIIAAASSGTLNTDFSAIGSTYNTGYEDYERNSGTYSFVFIIYSLTLPLNFIANIWGLYFFKKLPKIARISFIFLIVSTLLFYTIGSGKQKQLGDTLIFIISVAALRYGARGRGIPVKTWIAAFFGGIVAILGFTFILGQRYANLGISSYNINDRAHWAMTFDLDHPIFKIFGNDFGFALTAFLSYLSQGYYGLSLAMQTQTHWTYFMGFSYSLSVLSNRVLGIEWVWPDTVVYQTGVQFDWGQTKWHTAFAHFATDFTFPGTVILFGFFAYIYARAWHSAIRYRNPFSILMFSLLTLGVFFLPANNQLLHSPGSLFTTLLISFLYLRYSRQFNSVDARAFNPRMA